MKRFEPSESQYVFSSEVVSSDESYPDPVSMTRDEFENFWTEKLTGFQKEEQFDLNNQDLITRMKSAKVKNVQHINYLLRLAPTILEENPERIIESLLEKIYDKIFSKKTEPEKTLAEIDVELAKHKIRQDIAEAAVEEFNVLNYSKVSFEN